MSTRDGAKRQLSKGKDKVKDKKKRHSASSFRSVSLMSDYAEDEMIPYLSEGDHKQGSPGSDLGDHSDLDIDIGGNKNNAGGGLELGGDPKRASGSTFVDSTDKRVTPDQKELSPDPTNATEASRPSPDRPSQ